MEEGFVTLGVLGSIRAIWVAFQWKHQILFLWSFQDSRKSTLADCFKPTASDVPVQTRVASAVSMSWALVNLCEKIITFVVN